MELNQRPIGYEPTALTPELQALKKECFLVMAEGMGFEPTEPVRIHSLSRGARSTALAPFHYIKTKNGGETGIRTLGALRHDGFQDRCFRPLSHLSTHCNMYFIIKNKSNMAPPTGFEPVTKWLTAIYSTTELRRNIYI